MNDARRLMTIVLSLLALCGAGSSYGQADPETLHALYPPGSINSVDRANEALGLVEQERQRMAVELIAGQKVCYSKFLASACINELNARQRAQKAHLDAIDLEAKRYKRQEQGDEAAAERQRHLDERATNGPQDQLQRTQRENAFGEKQTDAVSAQQKATDKSAGDAARAQSYTAKVAGAEHKEADEAKRRTQADATQAVNEKAQADKIEQADERRARLAKKHAEKEAERARKAQQQATPAAATPGGTAPAATPSSGTAPAVGAPAASSAASSGVAQPARAPAAH